MKTGFYQEKREDVELNSVEISRLKFLKAIVFILISLFVVVALRAEVADGVNKAEQTILKHVSMKESGAAGHVFIVWVTT